MERQVRIFKNGRNRAVRIPVAFDFPGDAVIMRKESNKITLEPVNAARQSFSEWLRTQPSLDHDDMDVDFDLRELPPRDIVL